MIHKESDSQEPSVSENTRVLNVAIPESVYWHLRQCATESRLSMKDYMSKIGKRAKAIDMQSEDGSDVDDSPSGPESCLREHQYQRMPSESEGCERS